MLQARILNRQWLLLKKRGSNVGDIVILVTLWWSPTSMSPKDTKKIKFNLPDIDKSGSEKMEKIFGIKNGNFKSGCHWEGLSVKQKSCFTLVRTS